MRNLNQSLLCILITAVITAVFLPRTAVQAQQQQLRLEEVVVTAQRREQSLQEVPISLNVYSGADIELQGYADMEDLSKFSPSVWVRKGVEDSVSIIRGFGSQGNAMTIQSAAPVFLDGIHFGRRSMIQTAFLDVERVEVLKGPQPLHFGMNATAGAFNIVSKRPTPQWEGDFSAEFGNFGHREVSLGLGGPLTDTLGIRLAGQLQQEAGPLKNPISKEKMPNFDHLAGRVLLEWTPNNNLNILGKFDIARLRNGADSIVGCLTGEPLVGFDESSPLDEGVADPEFSDHGNVRAAWAEPPIGVGPPSDVEPLPVKGEDCFEDPEFGISMEGPFLEPIPKIFNEQGNAGEGMIDIRRAAHGFFTQEGPGGPLDGGFDIGGIRGHEFIDTWNALLDITYTFDNGININSQTGYIDFFREPYIADNRESLFLTNPFARDESVTQWSEQVRIESPAEGFDLAMNVPGGLNLEFMAGAFIQQMWLDSTDATLRATFRRGARLQKPSEDSEWKSVFGSLTFNLWDHQISLSGGVRYTAIDKDAQIRGHGRQWVFDEMPCDSEGTDANPETCAVDPEFVQVDPTLDEPTFVPGGRGVSRIDNPLITVAESRVDMDNLWTVRGWRTTTDVPLNWRAGGADAVGLTAKVFSVRGGPWGECAQCKEPLENDDNDFDFQVVANFTPNALNRNHTFYAKYAEAFRGPFADTSRGGISDRIEEITAESEFTESWEIGAKGTFLNQRVRYDISAFTQDFNDLQGIGIQSTLVPRGDIFTSQTINLDQTTDGVEFSVTALATENLTVNFAGMVVESTLSDFEAAGCSDDENIATAVDAANNPGDRSPEELAAANDILNTLDETRRNTALNKPVPEIMLGCRLVETTLEDGTVVEAGTKNRNGVKAAQFPDWKFVFGLNYTQPVLDNYEGFLNVNAFVSDAILNDPEEFNRTIMMPRHADINLQGGFGPRDGSWRIVGYVRNLLETTEDFNQEFDFEQGGLPVVELRDSNYRDYGVRFEYRFR